MSRWLPIRVGAPTSRLPIDPELPSPPRSRPAPFGTISIALVGLGGALGTLARYELSLAAPTHAGQFPSTTLLINLTGAFAIGLVLTILVDLGHAGAPRLFSCVGVLGGWTTMSTLALDADELLAHGRLLDALGYLLASLFGGGLATGLGMLVAARLLARRRQRTEPA